MVEVTGTWGLDEVENFLKEQTVPIRVGYPISEKKTWMISLWYQYESGELHCATQTEAKVVKNLRESGHCSFEVSTNRPPYKGVRGNGEVRLEEDDDKKTLRALIERYLGNTDSDLAKKLLADDREETRIRILPETVYSWDFTGRMPSAN